MHLTSRKIQPGNQLAYLFMAPAVVALLLVIAFPLLCLLVLSFSDWHIASSTKFIGFENYLSLAEDTLFRNGIKVSVLFVAGAVSIEFLLGFSIAWLLDKIERFVGIFRTVVMIPLVIPPVVGAFTFRMLYSPTFGLLNYLLSLVGIQGQAWTTQPSTALLAIIIADVWRWTPFVFLMMTAGLQSLPLEVFEAARVDGASTWQVLRRITIPMLRRIIIVTLIFRVTDCFLAFDIIYMITQGGPGSATTTLYIYDYLRAFQWLHLGYASALTAVMIFLSISFTVLASRLTGVPLVEVT
jgi:multiple sugar transport system permease protein